MILSSKYVALAARFPIAGLSLALLITAANASAQAVTFLGSGGAADLSGDGRVAVWDTGIDIKRWSAATGAVSIGTGMNLAGCSFDGAIVWAARITPWNNGRTATVWTSGGWTDVPIGSPLQTEYPLAVSDNGNALVFRSGTSVSISFAEVYDPAGFSQGVTGVARMRGASISADSLVAGGQTEFAICPATAVTFWSVYTSGVLVAADSGFSDCSDVLALSGDGSIALVEGPNFQGCLTQAIFDRSTFQLEVLAGGDLPVGSELCAMSADASLLVGRDRLSAGVFEALVWTCEDGYLAGSDYLEARGFAPLTAPAFYEFLDVSNDGSVLLGYESGTGLLTRIELAPWAMYRRNSSSANTLDLRGGGSVQLGGTFEARTSGSASGLVLTALTTGLGAGSLFGANVHVDLANLVGPVQVSTSSGGVSVATYPIPTTASLVGLTTYLQSASLDVVQPGGWSFSNGLKVTVRP